MIRFIIFLAILLLAISYFGISIRHIIESPTGSENFSYVWGLVQNGWDILLAWFTGFAEGIQRAVS